MEHCPVCRARLHQNSVCGRCGTDLSLPQAAARQAEVTRRQAMQLWRAGYLETALHLLRRTEQIQRAPLTRHLVRALSAQLLREALRALIADDHCRALSTCRVLLDVEPRHPLALVLQQFILSIAPEPAQPPRQAAHEAGQTFEI